ncbi:MAG: sugar phosphate isomerase/epimerase family protein [Gemmatimonadota bacterium]
MAEVRISGFADEIAADPEVQVEVLRANDVPFVEVRGVGGRNVLDLTGAEVAAFHRLLDGAGIGVSAIGSPIGKAAIRGDLEAHFRRFETALERARELGTRYVRVFSFYHEGEEPAAARETVVGELRRMAERAAAADLTLLHENEKGIYGDTPERCLDLVRAVASPHFRLTFDPANFVQCGVDPLARAWSLLAAHTACFHIKDAVAATGSVVPAGYGDGGVEEILRQALAAGFDGYLSVEPHLRAEDPVHGGDGPARFGKAVRALREVLERIGAR